MLDYNKILDILPYSLSKQEKEELITPRITELTKYHYKNCKEYSGILNCINFDVDSIKSYYDIPFIPVRLFKELDLVSVDKENIFKTMTSSGTTGQMVSKIYLDKKTASNQQKTLVKIVSSFTGTGRLPMIIIDCPSVVKNRLMFSARGAGILGFSIFGADKIYALDDDMNLNIKVILDFLEKHKGKKIFLFGFTYMIWQHFYKELLKIKEKTMKRYDFSNGILIHGGGWKKLISERVSPQEFHDRLNYVCGLHDIHDYYGMVEQTGCIYMQCEQGHLHASVFSDIIIRNPLDFSVCNVGENGIIQVISLIPESYPGHSLLTEDEGVLLGEDDCSCGRKGKYFKVIGRLKNAELRGCSDTYATKF
jgi:phenylacetate-coenzyme A ligase PaaK-like adenylate-forming protein